MYFIMKPQFELVATCNPTYTATRHLQIFDGALLFFQTVGQKDAFIENCVAQNLCRLNYWKSWRGVGALAAFALVIFALSVSLIAWGGSTEDSENGVLTTETSEIPTPATTNGEAGEFTDGSVDPSTNTERTSAKEDATTPTNFTEVSYYECFIIVSLKDFRADFRPSHV